MTISFETLFVVHAQANELAGKQKSGNMKETGMIEYVECGDDIQLAETVADASSEDVMNRIEEKVASFISQLASGEEPSLPVITRNKSNAVFCENQQTIRLKLKSTQRKLTDGKRFQGIWKVMQICYSLRKENKTINQRELYYMNTDVMFPVILIAQMFASQRECDDCIQECIALLHVPRNALGITATPKGYITGQ